VVPLLTVALLIARCVRYVELFRLIARYFVPDEFAVWLFVVALCRVALRCAGLILVRVPLPVARLFMLLIVRVVTE